MNVSIIGLGKIGFYYDYNSNKNIQTYTKAFSKSRFFNLKCAIDRKNKNIKDFKLHYPKVETSKNLKLLKKFKSEILIVSTNTNTHYKIIKDVLKIYLPKIIICEKPISYFLKSTKKVIDLCDERNIKLFVNYQRISNPIYLKIKSLIDENKNKFDLEINYSKGIYNNASHFINLILFLFGDFKKITLLDKKKNKNDYLVNFNLNKKNVFVKFKVSNKNSIKIKSKFFFFTDEKYAPQCMFKKKEIFNKKQIDFFLNKKYQYYVIQNLERFVLTKKNIYLCDKKKAFRTEELIDTIIKS
jgi:predicted dehydrogenase